MELDAPEHYTTCQYVCPLVVVRRMTWHHRGTWEPCCQPGLNERHLNIVFDSPFDYKEGHLRPPRYYFLWLPLTLVTRKTLSINLWLSYLVSGGGWAWALQEILIVSFLPRVSRVILASPENAGALLPTGSAGNCCYITNKLIGLIT